ncbi:MAG: RDD family protein [Candidatus Nanopelagicales bacterium]
MKFSEYEASIAAGQKSEVGDSSVPREARPFQGHRAGLVTRAVAALIDLGIVALTVVALNAIAAIVRFLVVRTAGLDLPHVQWSIVLGAAFLWSSWTWGWAVTGRTFGGHIMGLRVVSRSGEALGWATAAVRAAFCLVFPIGLLWVLVSRSNRSFQDTFMRTSVIHDWVMTIPSVPEES